MELAWNQHGESPYENGVDRGVLFPLAGIGVAWTGLVSVERTPLGGDREPLYFDGVKYYDFVAAREFQATVNAFAMPREFGVCIGQKDVIPGFTLTRQRREKFGFSYRTLVNGGEAYKIHMIYNATASPTKRGYVTLSRDSTSLEALSWQIDAVPEPSSTFKPAAHFYVDSRKAEASALAALEDLLYGTSDDDPTLPSLETLIDLFN